MTRSAHWEQVYRGKGDAELSWFQAQPRVSLALFDAIQPRPQRVVDVGGGQSAFVGGMLARGVGHVSVLDVSGAAIARAKERLGAADARVSWIVADVLEWKPQRQFDLWHDRAVFHFLTDAQDRARYVQTAADAVQAGGHVLIGAFALTGPEKCSGLPVCRYDAASLAREFGPQFQLVGQSSETHTTPWGKPQEFSYAVLQRTASAPPPT